MTASHAISYSVVRRKEHTAGPYPVCRCGSGCAMGMMGVRNAPAGGRKLLVCTLIEESDCWTRMRKLRRINWRYREFGRHGTRCRMSNENER
ncbi:hypothetical protein KCP74_06145 [Salmonella enterica subsp. enterica]|nr:hypothetical protein KCP74_06145 [Salmonella enterica subsp. enterica]